MSRLTAEKMDKAQQEKLKRDEALKKLTSTPFDLNNPEHLEQLKQYMDRFESKTTLYQITSAALSLGALSWFAGCILRIPDLSSSLLLLGAISYLLLQSSNTTGFPHELEQMQDLYNWCLKGNQPTYNEKEKIDNSAILVKSEIQRLIRLIAPMCSTKFMIAWPVIGKEDSDAKLRQMAASFFSFFKAPTEPAIDYDLLLKTKTQVENREFDGGLLNRIHAATTRFEALVPTVESIKNMLPEAAAATIRSKMN